MPLSSPSLNTRTPATTSVMRGFGAILGLPLPREQRYGRSCPPPTKRP